MPAKVTLAPGLSFPADEIATQVTAALGMPSPPLCPTADALPSDSPDIARRLWAQVERTGECWLWRGRTRNGYGTLRVAGQRAYTHRLSYLLHVGPIADGLKVCHRCDVHPCVRPDHFFLGTQAENLEDMRQKGRGSPPPTFFGSAHPNARISDAKIIEISKVLAPGLFTQRFVAALYGISQPMVSQIAGRRGRAAGVLSK